MVELFEELGGAILPCIKIERDADYKRYGVMGGDFIRDGVMRMNTIVEKPGRAESPSNLASVGGYLFTSEIFEYLERLESEVPEGQEFQVQPIMRRMMADGKAFFAFELEDAKYYDTGNKLEYLKTVVDFALKRKDLGDDFREYLRGLL